LGHPSAASIDAAYLEQAEFDEFQRQLAIAHLGGERWDAAALETVIENIRLRCAHHLWTVMTRVARLGPLLFGFKDYMLAAKVPWHPRRRRFPTGASLHSWHRASSSRNALWHHYYPSYPSFVNVRCAKIGASRPDDSDRCFTFPG